MSKFKEPREVIPLPASVVAVFASKHHRLHHAVWHEVRDAWDGLRQSNQTVTVAISDLGWEPPRPALSAIDGAMFPNNSNGSGIDFLFMHREMIQLFDKEMAKAGGGEIRAWPEVPRPGSNPLQGFEVPPAWSISKDPVLQRRFESIKSDIYYWARMRWWEREFRSPVYLRTLTLGELGSLIETSIHNDMHMRWASQPRDPETGAVTEGRGRGDISDKWDRPEYDHLGETYSSHVNPVFWRLHKWVDRRIEDWFDAHQRAHPGEVVRKDINGVPWFARGSWVEVDDPWSGPAHGGDHGHHHGRPDPVDTMKQVMRLLFPPVGPASGEQPGPLWFGSRV